MFSEMFPGDYKIRVSLTMRDREGWDWEVLMPESPHWSTDGPTAVCHRLTGRADDEAGAWQLAFDALMAWVRGEGWPSHADWNGRESRMRQTGSAL